MQRASQHASKRLCRSPACGQRTRDAILGARRSSETQRNARQSSPRKVPNSSPLSLIGSAVRQLRKRNPILRTLQSFVMVGAACAAFAAALAGCGSSDTTTPSGTAGAGTAGAGTAGAGTAGAGTAGAGTAGAGTAGAGTAGAGNVPGDAANGATLFVSDTCNSCHGDGAEGGIGPNISGSPAGIGTWTQAQFFNAVRNGTARSGAQLCGLMVPFPASCPPASACIPISDQGIYDIYAFVTSKMVAAPAASPSCNTP
jgi:Cytochrome C oxidase, cbb3-type, subunit III